MITRVFKKNKFICKSFTALLGSVLLCANSLVFTGCAAGEPGIGTTVYYLNNEETKLETHKVDISIGNSREEDVEILLEMLADNPNSLQYKAPLGYPIELTGYKLEDKKITLDFAGSYYNLPTSTEVLIRAAIVQTLLQVENIRYVFFTVDGNPLVDAVGKGVGRMSSKTFIYNDGNQINTYDEVVVKLYFANSDGNGLISAYRDKFYSTNVPLELFVVEETIAGPSGQIEGLYPTINPETNVISVSTSDGICYVNLDSGFTTTVGNVPTEVAAYSLVNALTELPSVDKVQILVNGSVPSIFSSSTFERNDDIITTLNKTEE
ncbi:MAG: GerMN domain-containing protein [Lachnospiraceae bacterium]|nr:GerMN domain-containing protein [Lachnospiraceae bacterium]